MQLTRTPVFNFSTGSSPLADSHDPFIKQALGSLTKKGLLRMDDLVTILAGNFRKARQASFLEVTRVSDWLMA